MDIELAKQAMRLIRDFERGGDATLEIDSQAIASLTTLFLPISLSEDMDDNTFAELFGDDEPVESGLTAIKILASHNAVEAIDAIVAFIEGQISPHDYDDYPHDTLPEVLSLFGTEGIALLLIHAAVGSRNEATRCLLIDAVKQWGQCREVERTSVATTISKGLNNVRDNPIQVNTDLMMLVVDWKLKGFGELIERAFSYDRIDCGMAGEWEAVRRQLHVEGMRLPMPEKPYNSMEDFKKKLGIGIFSDDALFMHGEIDEQAAAKYLDNAMEAFRDSDEGQRLQSKGHSIDCLYNFLDLGLNDLRVTVDLMTVTNAQEILLGCFPRKLSMDANNCTSVIDELCAFWHFVDRVHQLESAKAIGTEIHAMLAEFRQEMSNTDNFGMAKSLVMSAMAEGFDLTSQEDIQKFINQYNSRLVAQRAVLNGNESSFARAEQPIANAAPNMSLKQRKKLLAKRKRK